MHISLSLFRVVLLLMIVAGAPACTKNPLGTALPLNLANIPKIQPQLDRLSAEERELVLGYLKRSNGDVLPPQFADPDAPFTARTFAEAIKLQREFKAKQRVEDARADSRREDRESAMEPLRMALGVELAKREILTADEASGREARQGQALDSTPTLVTTYRLINTSGETITHAAGSITIRTQSEPASLMGVTSCYINRSEPIPIGAIVEVRCGNTRRGAGDADREFLAMPESSLLLTWEPKSITLATGKVMKSAD